MSKIRNVFSIATSAAKKLGHKSFKEGSPGKEKRGEIAEAIKREMKKMQLEKALPIWALPDPGSHGKLVRPKKEIKKEPPSDMGSSTNKPYVDADEHFDALAKFMKEEFDVDLEKAIELPEGVSPYSRGSAASKANPLNDPEGAIRK